MGPHGAPVGPIWGGTCAHPGGHMGPLGPYGADLPPSPPGQLQRSSQGRFFPPENNFLAFLVQKWVKKKLRLRGWDLSSEIRSGILCRLVLVVCKTVGWRPSSSQIGVILGPLGFRPQLAHPCLTWPMWSLSGGKSEANPGDINGT